MIDAGSLGVGHRVRRRGLSPRTAYDFGSRLRQSGASCRVTIGVDGVYGTSSV